MQDVSLTGYLDRNGVLVRGCTIEGRRLGLESKRYGVFKIAAEKVIGIHDAKATFLEADQVVSVVTAKKAVTEAIRERGIAGAVAGGLQFTGEVVLTTKDQRVLTCDRMRWEPSTGHLVAGSCIYYWDNKIARIEAVNSDPELKNLREGST
jgi:hypothetical protein